MPSSIAVTADDRLERLSAALESGINDYILKPVDPRILAIRIVIAEQRSLANAASRCSREALRESESRFEAFMANSPMAAFIKDAEGRFLYVNRRYLELFKIGESDRIGRSQFDVFSPEVAREKQITDAEVLEHGVSVETVERVPLPDGVHDWLTYKFPLHDNLGHPTLVAGLAVDITDRIRAEQAEARGRRGAAAAENASRDTTARRRASELADRSPGRTRRGLRRSPVDARGLRRVRRAARSRRLARCGWRPLQACRTMRRRSLRMCLRRCGCAFATTFVRCSRFPSFATG